MEIKYNPRLKEHSQILYAVGEPSGEKMDTWKWHETRTISVG